MHKLIPFREGDETSLADEFIQLLESKSLKLKTEELADLSDVTEYNVLAVHYADAGAQGEAGAVYLLYHSHDGTKILCGNYVYGNLNLNDLVRKIPMLKTFDRRYSFELPFPFGGEIEIPNDWCYYYMGCMNHLLVREMISDRINVFLNTVIKETGSWNAFDAIAWFCGA